MAYNEYLVDLVTTRLMAMGESPVMKKMFGGLCWLQGGHMAFGVNKDYLIVRTTPEKAEEMKALPGIGEFVPAGRPMKGWISVGPEAWEDDEDLSPWITMGLEFAGNMPPR